MASLIMHVCVHPCIYVCTYMHVHVTTGVGTVSSPQFRCLALLHFCLF